MMHSMSYIPAWDDCTLCRHVSFGHMPDFQKVFLNDLLHCDPHIRVSGDQKLSLRHPCRLQTSPQACRTSASWSLGLPARLDRTVCWMAVNESELSYYNEEALLF